jgi:hypothetical protein
VLKVNCFGEGGIIELMHVRGHLPSSSLFKEACNVSHGGPASFISARALRFDSFWQISKKPSSCSCCVWTAVVLSEQ